MYCEYENSECVKCGLATRFPSLPRNCCNSEDCRRGDIVLDKPQDVSPVAHGPGTELSKLLKRFGINPTPTCACRAKAQEMDLWGCEEASKPERIGEVVAVMRAEAEARGLPFLDLAGRMLVWWAIHKARPRIA